MAMATKTSSKRAVKRRRIVCKRITEYMRMVETGTVETCKEQKQLVEYVRMVFAEEELIIDTERIENYERLDAMFPFQLYPWEWFVFVLFMCVFRKDGRPRWSQLFLYVGRGAGKNGFLSFLCFACTTKSNGIPNYDVDICATTEDQAKRSFDEVHEFLDSNRRKFYNKSFYWNKTYIQNLSTRSIIKYRTDNPESKDGLRSGLVAFDEVHAYTDWRNINVFTSGLGKKPHPRRIYTTTDGYVRDGVIDALKAKAFKILNGEIDDNGFLPFVCRLDDKDEVHDQTKWEKSNPSLRYKPDLMDEIKTEYTDYLENPEINTDFMTKRMNLPTQRTDLMVTKWENVLATNKDVPSLYGKPCVCGIDFAQTTDMVSAFLLFRVDGMHYGIHHSWFCAESKDASRIKIRSEFPELEKQGILTIVNDVDIHPSLICEWIREQSASYDIRKIAMDMYRQSIMKPELRKIGFSCKEDKNLEIVRPSDIMLVHPIIDSLFARQKIAWGDDKLMRLYTNNTKLTPAPHGNYTYEKIEPRSLKTDGFMAFVAAMTIESAIPEENNEVILEPLVF